MINEAFAYRLFRILIFENDSSFNCKSKLDSPNLNCFYLPRGKDKAIRLCWRKITYIPDFSDGEMYMGFRGERLIGEKSRNWYQWREVEGLKPASNICSTVLSSQTTHIERAREQASDRSAVGVDCDLCDCKQSIGVAVRRRSQIYSAFDNIKSFR